MEKLAIHGGTPVKKVPFGTTKRFAGNELEYLKEALEQNTLFYWKGGFSKRLCESFAKLNGSKHCAVTSSGTSAIQKDLSQVFMLTILFFLFFFFSSGRFCRSLCSFSF